MTEHLLEAYRVDFMTRTNSETGSGGQTADGHAVNAHEIRAGVVYRDSNVTVTAFPTKHAMESYGYRFDTPDRSIVITGDTNPTQATIDACHGCDVLIHGCGHWRDWRRGLQLFNSLPPNTTPQACNLPSWPLRPNQAC